MRVVRTSAGRLLRLSFPSGWTPRPDEPGAARWTAVGANQRARAHVLEHPDGRGRPWVVLIHGTGMGYPEADVRSLGATHFFRDLGCNVVMPILPMHGSRRPRPGVTVAFPGLDVLDDVHGLAQSAWDVRRIISWVRADPRAGRRSRIAGISLGGYVAALVAGVETPLRVRRVHGARERLPQAAAPPRPPSAAREPGLPGVPRALRAPAPRGVAAAARAGHTRSRAASSSPGTADRLIDPSSRSAPSGGTGASRRSTGSRRATSATSCGPTPAGSSTTRSSARASSTPRADRPSHARTRATCAPSDRCGRRDRGWRLRRRGRWHEEERVGATTQRHGRGVPLPGERGHDHAGPGDHAARPVDGAGRLLVREDQGPPRASGSRSCRSSANASRSCRSTCTGRCGSTTPTSTSTTTSATSRCRSRAASSSSPTSSATSPVARSTAHGRSGSSG